MNNTISKSNDFSFSLEENAIDFLITGIEHFIEKEDYKYSVINIYQSIELFLKARLSLEHKLLIYSRPENCNDDSFTVNFKELTNRLLVINVKLNKETIEDINELRKFRNRLIHHRISVAEDIILFKIGRGIRFLEEFLESELNIILKEQIEEDIYNKLKEIIYTYEERVDMAKNEMDKNLPFDKDRLFYDILYCPECGEKTITYPDDLSEISGEVHCYFCKNKFYVWMCNECGEIQFGSKNETDMCNECWNYILSKD